MVIMIIKNNDQIEEIQYLIPPVLNMYGVSEQQNETVLKKVFGLQLKKMRLMRGYTQTKLAKAIGVTFQQVQKYERGQNLANPIRLLALTQYFNVTIDYWVKPILNRELLLIKKKRGINVYPFKERFLEKQTHQSHE